MLATSLLGCVDHQPGLSGTASLQVNVTAPADLGSSDHRLGAGVNQISVEVRAIDQQGNLDTGFDVPVKVYPQFLGSISTDGQTILMTGGVGTATVMLPEVFGPTYLWIEDATVEVDRQPTYATGTSQVLWFREPFLEDISQPDLGNTATWLSASPLEGKQVKVSASKHGASGRLVVTGVYAQGFTLSDVDCAEHLHDAQKPCVADPFNHVFVFSFGRPRDAMGRAVVTGQTLTRVSGGVGEFNGFTELNFPEQLIDNENPDESLLPAPVVIDKAWLTMPTAATGEINLEKVESALVEIDGATVCPTDADYTKYTQWKLDLGLGCRIPINVITAGQVPGIDPIDPLVGKKLTKVIGTLKAVNIGNFNVWIVLPRRASDITQ